MSYRGLNGTLVKEGAVGNLPLEPNEDVSSCKKAWKKRFAVLTTEAFAFFKSEKENEKPLFVCSLKEANIRPAQQQTFRESTFSVYTSTNELFFACSATQDLQEWLDRWRQIKLSLNAKTASMLRPQIPLSTISTAVQQIKAKNSAQDEKPVDKINMQIHQRQSSTFELSNSTELTPSNSINSNTLLPTLEVLANARIFASRLAPYFEACQKTEVHAMYEMLLSMLPAEDPEVPQQLIDFLNYRMQPVKLILERFKKESILAYLILDYFEYSLNTNSPRSRSMSRNPSVIPTVNPFNKPLLGAKPTLPVLPSKPQQQQQETTSQDSNALPQISPKRVFPNRKPPPIPSELENSTNSTVAENTSTAQQSLPNQQETPQSSQATDASSSNVNSILKRKLPSLPKFPGSKADEKEQETTSNTTVTESNPTTAPITESSENQPSRSIVRKTPVLPKFPPARVPDEPPQINNVIIAPKVTALNSELNTTIDSPKQRPHIEPSQVTLRKLPALPKFGEAKDTTTTEAPKTVESTQNDNPFTKNLRKAAITSPKFSADTNSPKSPPLNTNVRFSVENPQVDLAKEQESPLSLRRRSSSLMNFDRKLPQLPTETSNTTDSIDLAMKDRATTLIGKKGPPPPPPRARIEQDNEEDVDAILKELEGKPGDRESSANFASPIELLDSISSNNPRLTTVRKTARKPGRRAPTTVTKTEESNAPKVMFSVVEEQKPSTTPTITTTQTSSSAPRKSVRRPPSRSHASTLLALKAAEENSVKESLSTIQDVPETKTVQYEEPERDNNDDRGADKGLRMPRGTFSYGIVPNPKALQSRAHETEADTVPETKPEIKPRHVVGGVSMIPPPNAVGTLRKTVVTKNVDTQPQSPQVSGPVQMDFRSILKKKSDN